MEPSPIMVEMKGYYRSSQQLILSQNYEYTSSKYFIGETGGLFIEFVSSILFRYSKLSYLPNCIGISLIYLMVNQ